MEGPVRENMSRLYKYLDPSTQTLRPRLGGHKHPSARTSRICTYEECIHTNVRTPPLRANARLHPRRCGAQSKQTLLVCADAKLRPRKLPFHLVEAPTSVVGGPNYYCLGSNKFCWNEI